MSPWVVPVITVLVWAVMLVRSPDRRALLYSLPLPMTAALLASGGSGAAAPQYLGVLLLVGFFAVVAGASRRVPRLVAVLLGVGAYVGGAALLARAPLPPDAVVVAALLGLWGLHRGARRDPDPSTTEERPGAWAYLVVPVSAGLSWALGAVLGPLVVTFPYSGVPVALALAGGLAGFAHRFADRAVLLLGFLLVYHSLLDRVGTTWALVAAWAAFLLAAALTRRPRRAGRPAAGRASWGSRLLPRRARARQVPRG